MKKNAFTLAEVLITLGIIGVVAALVMPGMLDRYEKRSTILKTQKTLASLQGAVQLAAAHDGNEYLSANANVDDFIKWISPYLPIAKRCTSASDKSCGLYEVTCLHGRDTGCTQFVDLNRRFLLTSRAAVSFQYYNNSNIRIAIDVDGAKGKNRVGYDTWIEIYYRPDYGTNLLADYAAEDYYPIIAVNWEGCNIKTDAGKGCLTMVMKDGWKINYR